MFQLKDKTRKKEPKPKLAGPDIFGWGEGLPREGVGAKKFGMSFEAQGNSIFWAGDPGIFAGMPRAWGLFYILQGYFFRRLSENTLQNKHNMDISKVCFTSQGYFCSADPNIRECSGDILPDLKGEP